MAFGDECRVGSRTDAQGIRDHVPRTRGWREASRAIQFSRFEGSGVMKDFRGKTAFITGGASGIGLSMARAFGHAGMNVVLADIDEKAAKAAADHLAWGQVK